jgi:RNA polymerase sigma-70 factor (ECF subfamily)
MDSSASIITLAADLYSGEHRMFSQAAHALSMTALNDDDLMQLAGEGDRDAFGRLVERHVDRCVAIAQRSLGGKLSDAEDVAQDAMMRLWRHAPRWQTGRAKVSTWLYRVVVNLCIDHGRKNKRYGGEVPEDTVDETPSAYDALAAQGVSKAVRDAIQELPERQRTVLALCFYEGMSNADAAEVMELSVGAVEQLLVRARRSLRVSLADLRE